MGDVGRGMFVRPGIPEFMRDTVVPRPTSSRRTSSSSTSSPAAPPAPWPSVLDAADVVRAHGPRDVLVTSVLHDDIPEATLDLVAVSDEGAWAVTTPLLPITPERLRRRDRRALPRAPADEPARPTVALAQHRLVGLRGARADDRRRDREIQLVAAQDALAQPPMGFEVRRLR